MREIKLAYSNLYNAGDLMNVDIVQMLGNGKVKRTKTFAAEMTAIGGALYGLQYSDNLKKNLFQHILRIFYGNKPIYIWGSGFLQDYNSNRLFRHNLHICALRGAKTQEKLFDLTGTFFDVPLADAGLLIDSLIKVPQKKKYKIGLIPHMLQQGEDVMTKMAESDDVHIIDIRRPPQEVGIDIAHCEAIASSSLHGLIFADAFHIPNIHIKGRKDLPEGNFKFEDYYSSFGLWDSGLYLHEHIPTFDEIVTSYRINSDTVEEKKKQLIECFPTF